MLAGISMEIQSYVFWMHIMEMSRLGRSDDNGLGVQGELLEIEKCANSAKIL